MPALHTNHMKGRKIGVRKRCVDRNKSQQWYEEAVMSQGRQVASKKGKESVLFWSLQKEQALPTAWPEPSKMVLDFWHPEL